MTETQNVRRSLIKAGMASAASLALPALAQSGFPQGPVRIIVGLPPGGSADVIVRTLGSALERSLKQPVIVDNRPGGQFRISVQALLSAPPDGHTLLYVYNGYVAVQVTDKLFDLDRDTTPVTQLVNTPILLVTRSDSRFKTMADVVSYAKANPGKLNYGTLGNAGLEHMKMALIEKAAGIRGLPVPYKGGPDLLKGLLAGDLDMTVAPGIFGKTFGNSGKLRMLAVLSAERWKEFPDVPTLREAGVPTEPLDYWGGLVMRAGTPPDRVDRIYRDVALAMKDPDVLQKLADTAHYPAISASPGAFGTMMASDARWMAQAARML